MLGTASRMLARALFVCAFVLCGLLLLAGRAHALTGDPPTADATGTSSDAPATPPTTIESQPPPAVPQSEPTPTTPAGAGGPDDPGAPANSNTQDATVTTTGTSVGNTGSNTAVAGEGGSSDTDPTSLTPTSPTPTSPTANSTSASSGMPTSSGTPTSTSSGNQPASAGAGATTGPSAAVGDLSTSTVAQQVSAQATDSATVDVVQIALIVNVGIAQSVSGQNVAAAGSTVPPTAGTTSATDHTGNAAATGDAAHTTVVQGANVGTGESSTQTTTVLNVGIAISNSGINVTIATVGANPDATTTAALAPVAATGTLSTGTSRATGDRSSSAISQIASVSATGNALVSIDQRAIIVNFGIAMSNTGANFALASFDGTGLTPDEQAIINALLSSLAPMLLGSPGPAGGTSGATILTGNATGVGNGATSAITQTAGGTAGGTGIASVGQLAQIANFGIAIANTGLNGAFAGAPGAPAAVAGADLAPAEASLAAFFSLISNPDWLQSANPFAAFEQTVDINGVTLDLGGTLDATQLFAGFDGLNLPADPLTPGVHVTQITGVLDIGIASSDSGDNTVISVVGDPGSPSDVPNILVTAHTLSVRHAKSTVPAPDGALAQVTTGRAWAVGNASLISVCQSFHSMVCVPPVVPPPVDHRPPTPPGSHHHRPAAQPVAQAVSVVVPANPPHDPVPATTPGLAASTLPMTGSGAASLAELAAVLIAAGAAIGRRRRRVH